jgi:signal transduction histidine kinase
MRIVSKINLTLAAVVGVSAVLNFAALNATVAPRFTKLENEAANQNQQRVIEAIELQKDQVAASARDYAFWDDTFAYMHGQNDTYEAKNLTSESMKALNVNFYLALNEDGGVKIDKGFNYSGDEPQEIRLLPDGELSAAHPLQARFAEPGSRTGLINTEFGVVAVGYAPILDSARKGPAAGTLLFGKLLDLDLLRTTTKVDFELRPSTGTRLDGAMTHSSDAIQVATTIVDLEGKPIVDVVSKTSRAISHAGNEAVWAALSLLVLGGIVLILTLAFVLRRIALRRIGRMQRHLIRIRATGALETLPEDGGKDELSEMVSAFNDMTAQLGALREQLRRQDYQHGAADHAADILHNIRNAISPIGAILSDLGNDADAPWKSNLEKALGELKAGELGSDRQNKLTQFVSLSAGRLLEEERKRGADVKTLQGIVRHVDGILRDEEAVSKIERVFETVDLKEQITSAAQVVARRPGISIEIDLAGSVCVGGHRTPLEQIWANLLINAAEAIQATGRGKGKIKIGVTEASLNGAPAFDVGITDDGDGIAPELMETIFQKGFSTRRDRSGGLGLHWCANAAGSMGGRLFAESEGLGHGATFHLILPRSKADIRSAA